MAWSIALAQVPDWMTFWATVVGLIAGTAAALEILRRGLQAVQRGWRALTKPWRELDALEDRVEELECNHRKPSGRPGRK